MPKRRKSRVAAARYKAECAHLDALWAPLKAAMDEENRAWWTGQSPPVHPGTPPLSTLETAQTRGNTGPVHPSTLSTHEKRFLITHLAQPLVVGYKP